VYLVDTDAISESRKGPKANAGVRLFFRKASREGEAIYVSAITVGELRRGARKYAIVATSDKPIGWSDGCCL
jgi:predicted nucleic acid-binding protein